MSRTRRILNTSIAVAVCLTMISTSSWAAEDLHTFLNRSRLKSGSHLKVITSERTEIRGRLLKFNSADSSMTPFSDGPRDTASEQASAWPWTEIVVAMSRPPATPSAA